MTQLQQNQGVCMWGGVGGGRNCVRMLLFVYVIVRMGWFITRRKNDLIIIRI